MTIRYLVFKKWLFKVEKKLAVLLELTDLEQLWNLSYNLKVIISAQNPKDQKIKGGKIFIRIKFSKKSKL